MPIHEIQLAFWTALKESNPELFNGNPQGAHYFDIKISGVSPLSLRLNIYLQEEDYEEKGVQSVSLVVPYGFRRNLKRLFENDCEIIHDDFIINRVKNVNTNGPISDDRTQWQPYIEWFTKYAQKLKELLVSWK